MKKVSNTNEDDPHFLQFLENKIRSIAGKEGANNRWHSKEQK